ncbi:uncharacterized protein LOC124838163 isoform X2 [Vigna umbellata]|uniref:uncharacterized protein LOC124838163 isoform X2 n=1 Tax=Vigna umbellata TaxID=87088 RepID=UPI001F5E3F6E|nr:uncharacterized protein LOC124838163 isoform X2 [Vigna umbellata]
MHFGTCAAGAPHRWVHLHRQHGNREWTRVRAMARGATGEKEDGDTSYLEMWKKAVQRERKSANFKTIAERVSSARHGGTVHDDLEKKTSEFNKLLQIPSDERDRVELGSGIGVRSGVIPVQESAAQGHGVPGPDFWSWTPPVESDVPSDQDSGLQLNTKASVRPTLPSAVVEKERTPQFLTIPFESLLSQSEQSDTLPPFQSFLEVEKADSASEPQSISSSLTLEEEQLLGESCSGYAEEAANALSEASKWSPIGVNPDGTRWWKDTGIERRPDGVICRWTMTRGVSADKEIEWQEKYWEASDDFGYKELGSEKSGRDAYGNVWREFWRESMSLENGLMNFEKTADKWGSNGKGNEWQEKWGERYNAAGQSEKWADKWCSIDPNTPLQPGHAHVWHERWGGKYDGYGGSIKYTDKWAERSVEGGWEKWGDKWDENFDPNAHGVKQGESWWEGKHGERWNRTWGEQHNGSGWIHKYGKSSSGEHWDTHVNEETWYEKFPHYGFFNCYENSVQLRQVPKPSEILEVPKPSEILEVPKPSEILEVPKPSESEIQQVQEP